MEIINWVLTILFLLAFAAALVNDLRRKDKPSRFYYWKLFSNDIIKMVVSCFTLGIFALIVVVFGPLMVDTLVSFEWTSSTAWIPVFLTASWVLFMTWGFIVFIYKVSRKDFMKFTEVELDYRESMRKKREEKWGKWGRWLRWGKAFPH